jgi:hypothetical protein
VLGHGARRYCACGAANDKLPRLYTLQPSTTCSFLCRCVGSMPTGPNRYYHVISLGSDFAELLMRNPIFAYVGRQPSKVSRYPFGRIGRCTEETTAYIRSNEATNLNYYISRSLLWYRRFSGGSSTPNQHDQQFITNFPTLSDRWRQVDVSIEVVEKVD